MNHLIALIFLVPCVCGMLAFLPGRRVQVVLGPLSAAATTGVVAALAVQVVKGGAIAYPVGGWLAPLGIQLRCDGMSLIMLLLTGVICAITSGYSAVYFGRTRSPERKGGLFWPLWLFLWGGLNCLFVSGDVFNLYLLLEFTLLASVALAALGGSNGALVSAFRYLIAATIAALFYMFGVAFLYAGHNLLDLHALRAAAPSGLPAMVALGLMTGGLALKSALFPLHFWLPPAHSTAPAPVSAVLSALVVKAGFYVMLRIWMEAFPADIALAGRQSLAALGAVAVVWGSWQALRQVRLKMLIAYSTVAQMGYLFVAFPWLGGPDAPPAVVYQMVSHGLAKSGMFLGAGALLKATESDLLTKMNGTFRAAPLAVTAMIISGASLAGIAPGGGPKGKLLGLLADMEQWWLAAAVGAGMLLTLGYATIAVKNCFRPPAGTELHRPAFVLQASALALALLAAAASIFSGRILALLEIK